MLCCVFNGLHNFVTSGPTLCLIETVLVVVLIYYIYVVLSRRLSDVWRLPISLQELVRYSACLGENNADLQKALELMLSVPHRAQDDKFTSSIEGYKGSVHKLGRLLAHDRFSVTFGDVTKERYLFLFKARVLICKVRRISEDRSIFQLKDIIRVTVKRASNFQYFKLFRCSYLKSKSKIIQKANTSLN